MTDKQTVKFGYICREVKLTSKDPIADGYKRYIGLEHLDSGSLKIKRWGIIADDSPSFTKVFRKGDALIGKRRPYLKKAAIAEFDGICSGDIIVVEGKTNDINSSLIPYIIRSESFWDWAVKTSSGSLSPRTKWKSLAEFELSLPGSSEIESFLCIANQICVVIEKCENALFSCEELKRSLEVKLLTKGIKQDLELSKHRLGSFPKSWDLTTLEQIAKVTDGTHHTPTYVNQGVPFLRVTDIQAKDINLKKVVYISEKEHLELCKRCTPEKGDILLSKNGTIGITKLVNWDWEFSIFVSLCLIKITSEVVNSDYLELVLRSEFVKHQIKTRSKTGTITNLHLEEIREFLIPLPSLEEQESIVEEARKAQECYEQVQLTLECQNVLLQSFIYNFLKE